MTEKEIILSIRNLSKVYDNGVKALTNINLDIKQGEFLVIIGLSGSGKSTLLRTINQLISATTGQISFHGKDITHVRGEELRLVRKKIAMIFQQFNLVDRHSVLNNVLMGKLADTGTFASLLGLFSQADRADAQKYLDLVGIGDKARVRADSLSGGQQQRVAIARALTQNPEILLADEPVASLDPATCHTVMDYLEKINKELGITVICNLHFLSLVRRYATRVIALKGGEIVFDGYPKDIHDGWFRQIYGEEAKEVFIN